jgi:hypothetical protein
MIKYINFKKKLIAIVLRSSFKTSGIKFFTPTNSFQQLGYMNRKKNYIIKPHKHTNIFKNVTITQEVLFIKSGKLRVDLYSEEHYYKSIILNKGDIIFLSSGGHGFKMLKPTEIVEVKQGPYSINNDKIFIEPVKEKKVKIIN